MATEQPSPPAKPPAEPPKDALIDYDKTGAKLMSFYKAQMEHSGKVGHNCWLALNQFGYFRLNVATGNKTLTPKEYAEILALDEKFIPLLENLNNVPKVDYV